MTHPHDTTLPRATVTPSRRAVLRTAAWSLPAIQIAAATPAFAASGAALALTPAPSGQWTTVNFITHYMTGTVRVKNLGTDPTIQLRLTVTLPNAYVTNIVGSNATVSINNVTGGWTTGVVSYTGSGSSRIGTFVLTASPQLQPRATSTATFRVNLDGRLVSNFLAPVNVAATATKHTQVSGSFIPAPA